MMQKRMVSVVLFCILLTACTDKKAIQAAEDLRDESALLQERVVELEGKLEEAQSATEELSTDVSSMRLALDSIVVEPDGLAGYEVQISDAETAQASVESSLQDVEAALQ